MLCTSVIENVYLKIMNNAQLEIRGLIILCNINENVFNRNQFMNIGLYCDVATQEI